MNEFIDDIDAESVNNGDEIVTILRCNPDNPIMSKLYVSSSGYFLFAFIVYRIPTDVFFYEKHIVLPIEIIPDTDYYKYLYFYIIFK